VLSLVVVRKSRRPAGLQVKTCRLKPIGHGQIRNAQDHGHLVVEKAIKFHRSLATPTHVVIVRHRRHLSRIAFGIRPHQIHPYQLHLRLLALQHWALGLLRHLH